MRDGGNRDELEKIIHRYSKLKIYTLKIKYRIIFILFLTSMGRAGATLFGQNKPRPFRSIPSRPFSAKTTILVTNVTK